MPITFRADWALRVRRTDSGAEILHRTRRPRSSTDTNVSWFPLERAARLEVPEEWERWSSAAAGAPLGDKDEIVVFGRRGGPEVLDSELARLGHLAALAVSIGRAG